MHAWFPLTLLTVAARPLSRVLACSLLAASALAHESESIGSDHAVLFQGTGTGQQDRIRIPIDDDTRGPDGSSPCDVGAGDFTLEFWIRGQLTNNNTAHAGGDLSVFNDSWRNGNMLLDRGVSGGTQRVFGVSVAGGFIRFGTGAGDSGPDLEHTLEGNTPVLDDAWHHVACVRDASSGTVSIIVDGSLDIASAADISQADLSYPNAGVGGIDQWGPFLVIGAEKHDLGPAFPAFSGRFDELRIWTTARSAADVVLSYWRTINPGAAGLVGQYRIEEGSGTTVADASAAGSPAGKLLAGVPGNGEWTDAADGLLESAGIVAVPLPPGFVRSTVTADLGPSTCLAAPDDGRIFVGGHFGSIRVIDAGGALLAQPLISIALSQSAEAQGLLGMTLDPDFDNNGFLYVYYTSPDATPRNRVGRFTVVGNTANPMSEFIVWENISPAAADHLGGALRVGTDGFLYITTGDNFDSATSPDLSLEDGKLLRVALDGTVPALNPFVSIPTAAPTIWARGLRNPFRMSIDESSGELWIGDVGGNKGTAEEEVNRSVVAADFGWPDQEGEQCYVQRCDQFQQAEFAYAHDDPSFFSSEDPAGGRQGAAMLGPVYDGASFPPEYQGSLFLGDFAYEWIRWLERDAQGVIVEDHEFLRAPEAGPVVDLAVGADGALYYLTFGDPAANQQMGSVLYRIAYSAGLDQAPVALAEVSAVTGLPPLALTFDGAASFDPEGGALTYTWDFGDASGSSATTVLHTFTAPGRYLATLTVSDGMNATVSSPLVIDVGNAPVLAVTSPVEGQLYRAGEVLSLSGSATDVEDGVLDPSALVWSVVTIHAGHSHPSSLSTPSTFRIPKFGHTPEDTSYRFTLTATDSDGLLSTKMVNVLPEPAPIIFDTFARNIPIFIDGQAENTPRTYQSLPNYRHKVRAQEFFTIDGQTWQFSFWTDGKKKAHTYVTPVGGGRLRAIYVPTRDESTDAVVAQADHCAMYRPSTGQTFADAADPLEVTFGREGAGIAQAGFEFTVQVPQGALIRSAKLILTASSDQLGSPIVTTWAYTAPTAPAFVAADPTPLTAWAPLSDSYLRWALPAFTAGIEYESPDLATLVQQVVDQALWSPGNRIGIVLDGTPTQSVAWRSAANFASGTPPRLEIEYSTEKQGPHPIIKMKQQ